VSVKAFVDGFQLGSTQYVSLDPGSSDTSTFLWVPRAAKNYSVEGKVGIVAGEIDTGDNTKAIEVGVPSTLAPETTPSPAPTPVTTPRLPLINSVHNIVTVDTQGNVGLFTSLAFNDAGNPAISYCDFTNQDLKYAQWNGENWNIETVDSQGNVCWPTSLAFDTLGNPAIAYYDYDNCYLKYAHRNDVRWDIETVNSVGTTSGWNNYCMHISLVFDGSGNPAIAYYNGGSSWDLKYAHFTGTTWAIQTVYDDGLNGGWTRCASLAFDSLKNPAIAFRYFGPAGRGLGYAYWNGAK